MTILPALYFQTNCASNRLDAMFLSVFAIYILKMLYQILDAASNGFFLAIRMHLNHIKSNSVAWKWVF